MVREAIINPGSSSWWLLTLTPIIYFDQVRISDKDLVSVYEQKGRSTYNLAVSRVLQALERYADERILIVDPNLPARGRTLSVKRESKRIADKLLELADGWRPRELTIVRPSEIKNVMINAYREWIFYNRKKSQSLPDSDRLRKKLIAIEIPRWRGVLSRLKSTPARDIPDLLRKDPDLYIVYSDIIRNAYLLTSITSSYKQRAYDVLANEFLPAVSLIERYRIFHELSEKLPEFLRYDILVRLYDLRMERAALAASGSLPKPESIVLHALRERNRFAILRRRLSEIDLLIQEEQINDEALVHEVIALARDLHKQIQQIDLMGTALIWSSGAYFLRELSSTMDPALANLIRLLLINPITTKFARESLKDLYLSSKGISGGACIAIAAIRDYVATGVINKDTAPKVIGNGIYKFWV